MHDVVLVEDLECLDELFEDEECLFFLNDSFFAEHAFEGASIAVLVDEVKIVGGFEHIDILDDMLIFFNVGQDVDLVDCTFF